jgi:hypothetical protein
VTAPPLARDYRVDFCRGLALLFIFINHVPNNLASLLTLRTVALCDASEAFIFMAGYSAALVFQLRRRKLGFWGSSIDVWRRVWSLYVVHIFVFVLFTAQVSWTAVRLNNDAYIEEMLIAEFLQEPHIAVVEALLLRFQPRFLDILPLYIVLMLWVPAVLALPWRFIPVLVVASAALYLGVQLEGWHLEAYPDQRPWTFNPLGWQLLFLLGAIAGRATVDGRNLVPKARWLLIAAGLYVGAFAMPVGFSWAIAGVWDNFPALLSDELWPLRKADLDPWRLVNILALAFLIARLVPPQASWFLSTAARPVRLVGRHGLDLFCLGIFLSVAGHVMMTEVSDGLLMQFVVTVVGCGLMIGYAAVKEWSERLGKEGRA